MEDAGGEAETRQQCVKLNDSGIGTARTLLPLLQVMPAMEQWKLILQRSPVLAAHYRIRGEDIFFLASTEETSADTIATEDSPISVVQQSFLTFLFP